MRNNDSQHIKADQKRLSPPRENRDARRAEPEDRGLSDEGCSATQNMSFFKQPFKVLMTADSVGGVFSYAVELARSLNRRGASVTLAVMGGGLDRLKQADIAGLPDTRIIESGYKLEWMDDPWDDVEAAGRWLLEIENRTAPDIIHLNNFTHGNLRWNERAPVLVVGHSCVMSWWEAVRRDRIPRAWKYYAARVQAGLQAASCVAAPSSAMLGCLEKNYGPFRNSCFIHNGVDTARFWPGRKRKFILAAGRLWDDAKNVKALASIAGELAWPVFAAGDPHNSPGPVNYLGLMSRRALAAWYSRASIYALPARYEPFGLTALEAGLSGCALVLGDIPSLREVWGNAALFVDPEEPAQLRDAIKSLIADRGLLGDLSRRAREQALNYSIEKTADAYMRLYADMTIRSIEEANPGITVSSKGALQ